MHQERPSKNYLFPFFLEFLNENSSLLSKFDHVYRLGRYTYINIYSVKLHFCDQDRCVSETVNFENFNCVFEQIFGHRLYNSFFYLLSLIIDERV